jgi:lipopolysaccharide/colanic/teichoic acid biosynthesis glycosyltransferase
MTKVLQHESPEVPVGSEILSTSAKSIDNTRYYVMKRLMDIVVAGTMLLVLSPVMLVIALLVKFTSEGPIIFSQERVGARRRYRQDGTAYWEETRFRIHKFRSMVQNADSHIHRAYVQALIQNDANGMAALQGTDTTVRKLTRDPRITTIGHFLRKSSLDELPQLWNIVKGDMSLIGPRPCLAYELDMYQSWHRQRLNGMPGLTGWWQVTARSSADFDEMVTMDIWYLQQQSILLDLRILLKTPLTVLTSRGAM